ncbi:MAG: deoxynucleoside kinase [Candidatus Micrarchaeota archaeon]|nr:deoxynucleoside kinase [Candidatus Micrarchaeota archaeon]
MAFLHIAIEGISGSGKTDLGSLLEKPPLVFSFTRGIQFENGVPEVKFFRERVDQNPFLKDFYESGMKESYAFASQMFYLNARFVTNMNIKGYNGIALEDRSIFGDLIFAKNLCTIGKLSKEAFDEYCRHRKKIMEVYDIKEPDGIIFLDINIDTCLNERLKKRKTGESLDYDYWNGLLIQYREEFKKICERIPSIWIDANTDFLKNENYVKNVAKKANFLLKRILEKRKREESIIQEKLNVEGRSIKTTQGHLF